jgi:hypothetical protein
MKPGRLSSEEAVTEFLINHNHCMLVRILSDRVSGRVPPLATTLCHEGHHQVEKAFEEV